MLSPQHSSLFTIPRERTNVMADTSSKKKLLIIDDEANMRHMLSTVLNKADYLVDSASDGAEGLQLMEQGRYDFVLCDIKMPNMGVKAPGSPVSTISAMPI